MTLAVSDADVHRILQLVEDAYADPSDRALPDVVIERAFNLVACDSISFVDFDPYLRVEYECRVYPLDEDDEDEEAFWQHYWDTLSCSWPSRSGDVRTITTISDFYSQREFHQTGMYADYLTHFGIEHDMMMCLGGNGHRTRRILFWRTGGPDFDDRDRVVLALLRAPLNELYRYRSGTILAGRLLTPRQLELLQLVAEGHTNADIARHLFVSISTIRKHLENIYERLEVTNRTAAVARAFPSGLD
jgi:DNA-binding CsgD family transcriptional regulator